MLRQSSPSTIILQGWRPGNWVSIMFFCAKSSDMIWEYLQNWLYFIILKKILKNWEKPCFWLFFGDFEISVIFGYPCQNKEKLRIFVILRDFQAKIYYLKKSGVNFKFIQINDYTEVKRFWGEKNLVIIEILQNRYQNTAMKSEIWKMIFWTFYGAKLFEIPNFSHFLSKSKFKNQNNLAGISSLNSAFL